MEARKDGAQEALAEGIISKVAVGPPPITREAYRVAFQDPGVSLPGLCAGSSCRTLDDIVISSRCFARRCKSEKGVGECTTPCVGSSRRTPDGIIISGSCSYALGNEPCMLALVGPEHVSSKGIIVPCPPRPPDCHRQYCLGTSHED